jgi:acyl-CoA synthetase (AMP-forming)/AMP-acid ligase II/thioesterase domain-containing protein/acyl carrier protein
MVEHAKLGEPGGGVPDVRDDIRAGLGPWLSGEFPDHRQFPDTAVVGTIAERFFAVAAEFADRQAVAGPFGSWTYAELDDVVKRRAVALNLALGGARTGSGHAQAGPPGEPEPVAVMVTHDGPLVATLLAVIAAGHIVVVLDPLAPAEVTSHVLGSSGARVVLCDSAHRGAVDDVGGDRVVVEIESLDGHPGDYIAPDRDARSPVMLAFTSGTTGDSKGAVITNGVILNLVRGASNALGLGPEDRMPMLFPLSLAVASYPMFLPLLNGGALATLDVRSVGLDPLGPFLESERITVAYMAPTVIRFCVDAFAPFSFPDLRLLALGGELVDSEIVELSNRLMSPTLMANGFGTTETGVITLFVFDPNRPEQRPASGIVPAGHPVAEVELVILDESGVEVAQGDSGEIAVRTPHTFDGYWGYPEASAAVLTELADRNGWSEYRTGDLGKLDASGVLSVLGRVDTKVKVRGRMVVLGDVEAALCEVDEVLDAVVLPVEGVTPTELVAHVVVGGDTKPGASDLRERMLAHHESYRVPSRWVFHDRFPQLPNGKTDRRALLDRSAEVSEGLAGGAGMGDSLRTSERRLLELWRQLLPITPEGIDQDFAALGGDSLLAAQMLVMVEHRFDVLVPMSELIDARTIRQVASVIDGLGEDRGDATASAETTARVQKGDPDRPVLWFVPDLQGSAYRVRHLANALGEDQPVWSFESPLIKGEPNPYSELSTFVTRLLTDLREAQPEGPYYLGGYSFGGICAYEMARQLTAEGAEVAFLAVVDVGPGYRGPGWGHHVAPRRPWFGVAKPPDPQLSWGEKFEYYREMASASPARLARHLSVRSGLADRVDPLRFAADLRRFGRVRPEWRLWYAWDEHWKLAAKAWDRALTYEGRVDLFWASQTPSADNSQGWGPLVADLVIHRFDGDHDSLLEPRGVGPLAEALRSVLDTAIESRATPQS